MNSECCTTSNEGMYNGSGIALSKEAALAACRTDPFCQAVRFDNNDNSYQFSRTCHSDNIVPGPDGIDTFLLS